MQLVVSIGGSTCFKSEKNSNLNREVGRWRIYNKFLKKTYKVTKGTSIILKGEKASTSYLFNVISNFSNVLAYVEAYMTLWHIRLGHMSEKGMKILHSKNLFLGLKYVDLDFCENCVYGK